MYFALMHLEGKTDIFFSLSQIWHGSLLELVVQFLKMSYLANHDFKKKVQDTKVQIQHLIYYR